jgi:prepilin-type N-terminal cleavage/methylation domain-containing protein
MTRFRTALAAVRERHLRGDDGFSLMETIVAMVIFSLFMSVAMAAIISMLTSTQKSQNLTDSATQVENSFQKLDHQVRYSDAITPVGQVGANWYVEWHSQATSTTAETCYQLKYDATAKTLVERTWSPTASPIHATAWYQLAKNLTNNTALAAQYPFAQTGTKKQAVTGDVLLSRQQLAVVLVVGTSIGKGKEGSILSASFTALNSTTKSGVPCQEVARS